MILPKAKAQYDQTDDQETRDILMREDRQNIKRGFDIVLTPGRASRRAPRIILYSPSGDPFYLTVADDGTLGAVAV